MGGQLDHRFHALVFGGPGQAQVMVLDQRLLAGLYVIGGRIVQEQALDILRVAMRHQERHQAAR